MKRLHLFGIGLSFLVAFACNSSPDSVKEAQKANDSTVDSLSKKQSVTDSSTAVPSKQDADFMVKAASGGMLEVELGKLAQSNGGRQGVKDFGAMMVEDHGKGGETLKSLAASKRIVLPDSSATLDYMLAKTTSLLDTLIVYPENMLKNMNLTRGLVFSGQLLLALTQKGVSREDAYAWTQRNAMKVWDEGGDYKDLVTKDADISSKLSPDEIARVFDIGYYLRNVEKVFQRLFD